jgi:phosphoribosyl 1,2-cyclic phosphate phosphodiesterase
VWNRNRHGPDFRQQVLRENIRKLDALIFTHEHKDHTAGMDDIRSFNFLQQKDMPVYARANVINQLKQEFAYVFEESKYPGIPRVEVIEVKNQAFEIEGIKLTPIEVLHFKLPVFGYRIKDFTYITDAKTIALEEKEKIKSTGFAESDGPFGGFMKAWLTPGSSFLPRRLLRRGNRPGRRSKAARYRRRR